MTTVGHMDGYIIVNRHWAPDVQLSMGARTYGASAGEAWRRHIAPPQNYGPDFSAIVQRWSDKGYGPVKARLTLLKDEA